MPSTPTVLVVDDYPDALQVWGLYLRSVGFEVLTAADGPEALAQAGAHHPDLVVLDLELPGLSARRWPPFASNRDQEIPLIAATGYRYPKQPRDAWRGRVRCSPGQPCNPLSWLPRSGDFLQSRSS
jgi:CheY-like chemotaxis protein